MPKFKGCNDYFQSRINRCDQCDNKLEIYRRLCTPLIVGLVLYLSMYGRNAWTGRVLSMMKHVAMKHVIVKHARVCIEVP